MNEMTLPSRIRTLEVWGRARYFSITEASHIIEYLRVSREDELCLFETWMPERGANPWLPTFQAGSFNQCTSAPALQNVKSKSCEKIVPQNHFLQSSRIKSFPWGP